MAAEETIGTFAGQENGMAGPTGVSLLLVVGEPFSDDEKELVLERVTKALRAFESIVDGYNLDAELKAIAAAAPTGEEGPGGEQVIQHASEKLRATLLVNPQSTVFCNHLRNFLMLGAQHRILIHSGHVLQGSGGWIFQDDLLSFATFVSVFKEADVQNALKQQQGTTLDVHVLEEGEWSAGHFAKQNFSNVLKIQVNPAEYIQDFNGILQFTSYLSSSVKVRSCKELLQSSDVVGNIRFTRPTLYVFPASQGDSALFGISGFNLLVNAGYNRKACFWGFTRHLDRIDALLLTHLGPDNLFGVSSVFERKAIENVHPEIGHVYFNATEKTKHSPNGDISPENGGSHKQASLIINLVEQGNQLVENMKLTGQAPHPCVGHIQNNVLQPLNLYHKVGHGSLDMYVLNPMQDSKELKDFLSQWSKNVNSFTSTKNGIPLPSQTSVSALLVWKPSQNSEKITRILFPGNVPQEKIFEGIEKLKTLDIFKHASCSESSLHAPKSQKKPAAGGLKTAKATANARSSPVNRASPIPQQMKTEPKKSAPIERKPPASTRSTAASKPIKDAKNKKTTGAAQKEEKEKSKPTSPSSPASKGVSPEDTPMTTATPSNTPNEPSEEKPKKAADVAAEVAASLQSGIKEEDEVPEEVHEPAPQLVSPEPPVVTPEDVQPVVDMTAKASQPSTADLLGDFSAAPQDVPAEAVEQIPDSIAEEQVSAPPPVQPEPVIPEPQEPLVPVSDFNTLDEVQISPEQSPSVESVSEPSVIDEPQAVPEPAVLKQSPLDEPLVSFDSKEQVPEPDKDEDTSALDTHDPEPCRPDEVPLQELLPADPMPAAGDVQEADLSESSAISPETDTAPVHSSDDLIESPEALPEPQQFDQATFEAVAMHSSVGEDKAEELFSAEPQKEQDEPKENLPESEQPQTEPCLPTAEEQIGQLQTDVTDSVPAKRKLSISSEDEQLLPTPEETRAEGQFSEEFFPQPNQEEAVRASEEDLFAAESDQLQEAPIFQPPTATEIPQMMGEEQAEAERKRSLAEFGIDADDAALVESLTNADPQTLAELGIYDEPEADQQQPAEVRQELPEAEYPSDLLTDKDQPDAVPFTSPADAEADQRMNIDLHSEPASEDFGFVPEPSTLPVDLGTNARIEPPPVNIGSDEHAAFQSGYVDSSAFNKNGYNDQDNDSLADDGDGTEAVGDDSLEYIGTGSTEGTVDPPLHDSSDQAVPDDFEIFDAPRAIDTDPGSNPFVGVEGNNIIFSDQPNPFNIPEPSVEQSNNGLHLHMQQEDDVDRDSLEKEDPSDEFDPLKSWDHPMGLPAPDGPAPKRDPKKADSGAKSATQKPKPPSAGAGRKPAESTKKAPERATSPRKPASAPAAAAKGRKPDAKDAKADPSKKPSVRDAATKKPAVPAAPTKKPAASKPSVPKTENKTSPTKAGTRKPATGAPTKAAAPVKLAPVTPFYVDLTYIPGHGDHHYADIEFFRKVRARYYVLSSVNPSAALLTALLDAKQTWEDPSLEVTVIPTYDTDTIRHWMALHRDQLNDLKIEFAPSASRCTIQLQDHEASCAAYRLEF